MLGACLSVVLALATQGSAHAQSAASDAELAALIERARNNPLAQAAHARTQAAIAQKDEAAGNRWARFDATSLLAPSPRIRCDNVDCTQTSPQEVTVNVAGLFAGIKLNITQPLYTGGKIHYARRAAEAGHSANVALERELSGRVAVLVAEAYYGYLLAQELLWMLEDGDEQIESGRKTLEQKLAEGAPDASLQDRFRIAGLQSEVRARIADAQNAKTIALASLRTLVGDDTITLSESLLEEIKFDIEGDAAAPALDPRLQAAQHAVEAQTALEAYQRRSFMPDLALVGGVNLARAQGVDEPPGAFANDPFNTTSAYVAIAARWELAPWVQTARLRQQTAKKREAIATVEAAKRLSLLEKSKASASATLARARLAALKDGERAGKSWVASVLQADAIGAASAKDFADAYVAYFSSRASVLESTYKWNIAVFELRRQSGEFAASH